MLLSHHLSIFQLLMCEATIRKRTVEKRVRVEYRIPLCITCRKQFLYFCTKAKTTLLFVIVIDMNVIWVLVCTKKHLTTGGEVKNFSCLLLPYSFLLRSEKQVIKTTTFIRIFVLQLPWRWSLDRRWRSWWTRAGPGRAGYRIRCCRWHCSPPCPL